MNATLSRPGFVMDKTETAWRALLLSTLSSSSEGLVACDERLDVVFSTPRASQLLARFGNLCGDRLPDVLVDVIEAFHASGERTFSTRVVGEKGGALHVEIGLLRDAPPVRTVIWMREASIRDEQLYAALNERFGVTLRAFQLSQLVRQGLTNREIARELRLSEATVKAYLHDVFRVCGVSSRTALVALIEDLKNQNQR
jgi:DNA-binding NarL/FixJ family response regulator